MQKKNILLKVDKILIKFDSTLVISRKNNRILRWKLGADKGLPIVGTAADKPGFRKLMNPEAARP